MSVGFQVQSNYNFYPGGIYMAIVINPISPVAFSVFGMPVRWYALAYIAAFIVGFYLFKYLMRRDGAPISLDKKQLDDLLTAVILGVILGGRLGYVLFYNLGYFLSHPLEIFAVWHGGMSFHGGLIGVIAAVFWFAHRLHNPAGTYKTGFRILDMLAVVTPIGFFFGRIANFINIEVMGRPTDMPWAVFFNGVSDVPRHPSPLYEAVSEGILLFVIMWGLYHVDALRRRPGAIGGCLAMGYALMRIVCEQFRAPDAHIGFLTDWGLTMGGLLSAVMFIAGATVFAIAFRKK